MSDTRRQAFRIPRTSLLIGAPGIALLAWALRLTTQNYVLSGRSAASYQQTITFHDHQAVVYFVSRFGSCAVGIVAGTWLWSKTTGNRMRWWVLIAGWFDAAALGASYWPNRAGFFVAHFGVVISPILLLWAVFGWPSGRVERRMIRLPKIATVAYLTSWTLTLVAINATRTPPWGWRSFPVPSLGSRSLGYVLYPLLGTVGVMLDASIMIALTLQHRRLPQAARNAAGLVLLAGLALRGLNIVQWTLVQVGALTPVNNDGNGVNAVGLVVLVLQNLRFGVVVVFLAVAAGYRGKHVLLSEPRSAIVDIGLHEKPDVVEDDLAGLLDDPTVRLLLRRYDGTWMMTDGGIARPGEPVSTSGPKPQRRGLFDIAGTDGNVVATIEYDADRPLSRTAFEGVTARVHMQLLQTLGRAETARHLSELLTLQHYVIDAQDAARARLERDLHDGAQQHLVGLLLAGTLLARDAERTDTGGTRPKSNGSRDTPERASFAADLTNAAEAVRSVVRDAQPSALDRGLGAALHVLASSSPVPVLVESTGDLGPHHELTRPLWLLANEAVANALKHAAPTRLAVSLRVRQTSVTLTVTDDGAGGLAAVPRALAERAEAHGGVAMIDSERGRGTRITVRIPRLSPDDPTPGGETVVQLTGSA